MLLVSKPLLLFLTFSLTAGASAQFAPPPVGPPTEGPKKLEACQVIARIENQVVLASDILWEANLILQNNLRNVPPDQLAQIPQEQLDATREMLVRRALSSYVDTKLIYADFERKARGADMNAIRQQLNQPFFNGGSSGKAPGSLPTLLEAFEVDNVQDLEKKLIAFGTSLADRKEAYVEKAIAQTWIQEQINVDKPTYGQLSEYYQEHLEDYAFPTQARWEEITVEFSNHPNKQGAMKKLAEAGNLVLQRAQQKPESTEPLFTDVAEKYSEVYNAKDGGLNDWTTQGAMRDRELDQAIFSLPVGALSPIIETEKACHIVRVVERREAGHTPFAEVQDDIEKKMSNDDFRAKTEKFIAQLRRESRIWTIYTGNTTAEAFLKSPEDPVRR